MLNSFMFAKTIASLLILLGFGAVFIPGAPGSAARAEAPEPVAVISSASYDRWYDNVALLGKISGSPDLAQGLEAMLKIATANRGLAGLDKSRPWAVIAVPSGEQTTLYTYLPVTDLGQLIEAVQPFGKEIAKNGNTREIELADGRTFHAIEQNGWAVLTAETQTLSRAPKDPMRLLGDLPKRYDLALRLYISRLPEARRARFLAKFHQVVKDDRRLSTENDAQYAIRRRSMWFTFQALRAGARQLDQVTLGLVLDHQSRRLSTELVLVPRDGTPMAQRWSQHQESKSPLAGFHLPGATLTAAWAGTLSEATADMLVFTADTLRTHAPDDSAREAAVDVLEVIRSLLASRHLEGAAGAVLEPERATWVSAVRLPAGGQMQQKIEHFVSLLRRNPELRVGLELNTDRNGEVRLHTLSFPIEDNVKNRAALVRLFGQRIDIVVGIGKKHFYLATGRDALATLKQAIAASRTAPAAPLAPLECSVALGPVAEWAAQWAEGQDRFHAALIASALKESAGKDHVRLTVGPAEGHLRVRVELEEGILRIAGLAVGMVGAKRETAGSAAVE